MNLHLIATGLPNKGSEYLTRTGRRVKFVSESRYGDLVFRVIGSREELTLAPHYVQKWLTPAIRVPE